GPGTLCAATANGVFKSVDAGVTWNEADNGLGTPADHFAFSIALDPAKPGTLYAPTAHGLFKTTDGAASWIALPIGANNVTVDVSTPDSVYAVNGRVFRSTDGGMTWTSSGAGLPGAVLGGDVAIVAVDPSSPGTIYAGMSRAGIFKSTDGGSSWRGVNAGFDAGAVRALAMDPADPAILYAGVEILGLFRSTDHGRSWEPVVAADLPEFSTVEAIAVDPHDSRTILISTIFGPGGAYRTTDGGVTWVPVAVPGTRAFAFSPAGSGTTV